MDIAGGIIPQPSAPQGGHSAPEVRGPQADIPAAVRSSSAPRMNEKAIEATKDTDASRLDRVRGGAQMMKQALGSGETFAIYRNGSGELVTRFTNRTSGIVRYIPEQSVIQFKEAIDRQRDAIIDTQA